MNMNTEIRGFPLLAALGQVEEGFVHDAALPVQKRRPRRRALGAVCAAALVLAALALPLREGGGALPSPEGESEAPAGEAVSSSLTVNWRSAEEDDCMTAMVFDMDLVTEVYHYGSGEAWEAVLAEFRAAAGVSLDELLSGLEGTTFSLSRFYTRSTRRSTEDPYQVHDYCLELSTAEGGRAFLALSRVGAPLRDCLYLDDAPLLSHIGETELSISGMKTESETRYLTCFESGGVWYDVETKNVSLGELQLLLETLLLSGGTEG